MIPPVSTLAAVVDDEVAQQLWWFTARAGGIVAWSMLAASVIWGLILSTKVARRWLTAAWLVDLHRFLGAAACIFTAIHVAALVADSYVHFGPVEILVPFTGSWHPAAVGWGVLAMYLLVAVECTSLLRRRIPRTWWRRTHFLSFPLFTLSTAHALSAGTDRAHGWFRFGILAVVVVVAGLTFARLGRSGPTPPRSPAQPSAPEPAPAPVDLDAPHTRTRELVSH